MAWFDGGKCVSCKDREKENTNSIRYLSGITRFEVIDHREESEEKGRIIVVGPNENLLVRASIQDDGRTLKIFLNDRQ